MNVDTTVWCQACGDPRIPVTREVRREACGHDLCEMCGDRGCRLCAKDHEAARLMGGRIRSRESQTVIARRPPWRSFT